MKTPQLENSIPNSRTNLRPETLPQTRSQSEAAPTDFWQSIRTVIALQNQAPPLQPIARDGNLPLSFAQEQLWFLDQLEPDNPFYNEPTAIRLTGSLNLSALEQSLNEILRRHEALRTTFAAVDGRPVQIIAPAPIFPLPILDLQELPECDREVQALRLAAEEAQRPFNLSQAPLLRATLLKLGEEEYIMLLTVHHIVFDKWSEGILFRELAALYDAFSTGKPCSLPELPIQYADFAHWQREWMQGNVLESQLNYWKQQLGGNLPVLQLPTDYPRPAVQTYRGTRQSLLLSKHLTEALKTLSSQEGATLFMTLLAAFKTLLYRYSGQEDIIVGSPHAGRNRAEVEKLIGCFINTLVMRTQLSGNPSFREVLKRVRQVALGAYAHQNLPFEKLVQTLQPDRNLSHTPLFQVWFNMLNVVKNQIELPGLRVETLSPPEPASKFDLNLYAVEQKQRIRLDLVYNADLFESARMVEMLEALQHLLLQIVENPDERIARFSLVTPTAEVVLPNPAQVLHCEWEGAIPTGFSQQAQRVPDNLAVVEKQQAWSYQELDRTSNQLANYLRASGIQSQDVVAIYGHRSASLVLALLGVLKAGAAFVILDPAYPASRLIECLRVASPNGSLQLKAAGALPDALEEFVASLPCCCRLELPQDASAVGDLFMGYPTDAPEVAIAPDDLAYIAFTSGSTGRPKGILAGHRPLSHFLRWHSQAFNFNELDRFCMLSGLSHDPLLRDIFTPLWLGATLCIPSRDDMENPGQLANWMKQQEITIAHLTPAMGQLLTVTTPGIATAKSEVQSLRYVFFGGDVLTKHDVASIRTLAPKATCVNFYGATETPQAMGYFILSKSEDKIEDESVAKLKAIAPLGRGIKDVQLLILNLENQLAGIGEVGELHVRTPYLAQGYIGDDPLTQKRFILNPFTQATGDRLYRTGDLARYLPDGNIEFLGRIDHQVKIRGFRIELGEIEAVLSQHPAVRETAVIAREDVPGDKRLVAYVVSNPEQASTSSELRSYLKENLPDYMVPSVFVLLDALPLTPNGKLNVRALPVPDQKRSDPENSFVAPRTPTEELLANIWAEVLGVQQVGVHDNFFSLGGHSLLAIQLLSRMRDAFQLDLPARYLFQSPTVAGVAEHIEAERQAKILPPQAESNPESSLVVIQQGGCKKPFFFIPGAGGNEIELLVYANLARYLNPEQPVYGLKSRNFDTEGNRYTKLEAIAADYIKEIRAVQPEGPYLLGGECVGGILAFEIAQQLHAAGQKVALLALMDAAKPNTVVYFVYRVYMFLKRKVFSRTKIISHLFRRISHHLSQLPQLKPAELVNYVLGKAGKAKEILVSILHPQGKRPVERKNQVTSVDKKHHKDRPIQSVQTRSPKPLLNSKRRTYPERGQLLLRYQPQTYSGRIALLINEELNNKDYPQDSQPAWLFLYRHDSTLGWGDVAAEGVDIHRLPGSHKTYIRKHVRSAAEILTACIEKAQAEKGDGEA